MILLEKKKNLKISELNNHPIGKIAVRHSDLVIIHTEWNDFKSINFKKEVLNKNFNIFDMRNIYSPIKMKSQKIKYHGVGH